ncbi:MAG: molybdenum cofactor guanylyltransferase [Verrucomicrobiae bacterium]|nr:molybdenum cofactor guanylyltransferase [Verrucomicrobiae bacterium]
MNFSGAIVCGGFSTRMGREKALIAKDGLTLLERQVRLLKSLGAGEVLICCRREQNFRQRDCLTVFDTQDRIGPLAGIHSALENSRHDLTLCLAVDMPFLTADFLRPLLNQYPEGFIPRRGDMYEPLCALYQKNFLPVLRQQILQGQFRLQVLAGLYVSRFQIESPMTPVHQDKYFFNLNTPEKLKALDDTTGCG